MEKNDIAKIELTKSQSNVLTKILEFVNHPQDRVFILKGYAGTGKTTLMRFLIAKLNEQNKQYQLLASTGRAAKVLANLSGQNGNTSTIHSMVYSFNGLNKEYDEKEEIVADANGQLFLVFEPAKLDVDNNPETIYIIDEASMVADVATRDITQAKFGTGRLLKELLEYDTRPRSKYIFVGDPCQLPPIEQYFSPALTAEYFLREFGMNAQEAQLTEIMRQDDGNDIVLASKKIRGLYNQAPNDVNFYGRQRLWGKLPFRQCKNIRLHPNLEDMLSDYVSKIKTYGLNRAVCICGSNKACHELSNDVRRRLGFISGQLHVGDLLMVIQNNAPTGLMNGDMVTVEEISPRYETRACLTFRQIKVKELFTGNTYTMLFIEEIVYQASLNLNAKQQKELFVDFIIRMKEKNITSKKNPNAFYDAMFKDPYLNALRCVYGYAITCHKSQGGEWEDVYVHIPGYIMCNPTKATYQWVYTAMTRAEKTLHTIDSINIK